MEEWLTVKQIAQALQVVEDTVRNWIKEEGLEHTNVGSVRKPDYRVKRSDLETFLAARTAKTIEYRKKSKE